MVWSRGGAWVVAAAFGLSWAGPARAIPKTYPCEVWTDSPVRAPFLTGVPQEGLVLLPFELVSSSAFAPIAAATSLTVEVLDADGAPVPGYLSSFGGYVGDYWELGSFFPLWTSSRPLVPGARYDVKATIQNPECTAPRGVTPELTFEVAEQSLPDRLDGAVQEVEGASLDWVRQEFPPQCCVARTTEHCADPASCFACMKSSVRLNIVVPRTPSPVSPYLAHALSVRPPGDASLIGGKSFSAADSEVRVEVPLCGAEYCLQFAVTSPLTEESVESAPSCLAVSELQLAPDPDGALLVQADPCAEGSGAGSFRNAAPPRCQSYPEVRWFSNEVDGLVALGVEPGPAAVQATHGKGGAGGSGGTAGTAGAMTGSTAGGGGAGGTTSGAPAEPSDSRAAGSSGCSLAGDGRASGMWTGFALLLGAAAAVRRRRLVTTAVLARLRCAR